MADNADEKGFEPIVLETIEPSEKDLNDTYISILSSDFCEFIKKKEVLRAIDDCGFEYPLKCKFKNVEQTIKHNNTSLKD